MMCFKISRSISEEGEPILKYLSKSTGKYLLLCESFEFFYRSYSIKDLETSISMVIIFGIPLYECALSQILYSYVNLFSCFRCA